MNVVDEQTSGWDIVKQGFQDTTSSRGGEENGTDVWESITAAPRFFDPEYKKSGGKCIGEGGIWSDHADRQHRFNRPPRPRVQDVSKTLSLMAKPLGRRPAC